MASHVSLAVNANQEVAGKPLNLSQSSLYMKIHVCLCSIVLKICLHMFYVKKHIEKLCHDVIPVVSSPCPANKGRFVFFEIKQLSRAQGMRKGPQETAQLHTPGGAIVNCRVSGLMKGWRSRKHTKTLKHRKEFDVVAHWWFMGNHDSRWEKVKKTLKHELR